MTVTISEKAPDFQLSNQHGDIISLADFKGKHIILYFYPKDMTPGCTTEACDFRDQHQQFEQMNAVIIGVSPDSVERHVKFSEKHGLPFILVADDNHEAAERYDVWKLKKNFGKEYMGIERSTFLIDKEGIVVKEWRKVKVKGHVEEALECVRQLEN